LPYPFSDLLEAAGTKQTAIEIRKKKRRVHGVRTWFNRNSLHSSWIRI